MVQYFLLLLFFTILFVVIVFYNTFSSCFFTDYVHLLFSLIIINFSYKDNNITLRMSIMRTFKLKYFMKLSTICIILLLLLTPLYSFDENDNTHAYTVPVVVNFINISENGECFYSDEVNYTLDEHNNIVYYTIDKSANESINNISIECDGIYYDFEVNDNPNNTKIRVELYSDNLKKNKLTNRSVKLIYHYRSTNAVDVYDDVAVFNYTPWSDSKDTVSKLETYITYPADKNSIEIHDRPIHIISSNSWVNKHRFETRYKQITTRDKVTQTVLMPKQSFVESNYTNIIHQDKKQQLTGDYQMYLDSSKSNNNISYFFIILSVILIVAPLAVTFKYFKNSDTKDVSYRNIQDYDNNYIKVNMLINDNIGQVNQNAFYATLLNLINKGYIQVRSMDDVLYINTANSNKKLETYEKDVFNYLNDVLEKEMPIDNIKSIINQDKLEEIYKQYLTKVVSSNSIDEYFSNKTSGLLKYYSIFSFVYAAVIIMLLNILTPYVPIFVWLYRFQVILIPLAIISYILSVKIKNNWSKEGRYTHDVYKQFEVYLNDYSLIENNPPQSPGTWAEYIVISAAMGDDLSFRQNLIRYVNEHDKNLVGENDLIRLFYHDKKRSLYLVE